MKTLRQLVDSMTESRVVYTGPSELDAAINCVIDRSERELGFVPAVVASPRQVTWSYVHVAGGYYDGPVESVLLERGERNETRRYVSDYWEVDFSVARGVERSELRDVSAEKALTALLVSENRKIEREAPSLSFEFTVNGRVHPDLHQEKEWANTCFFIKSTPELRAIAWEIEHFFRTSWNQTPQQLICGRDVTCFNVRSPDRSISDADIERALRQYSPVLELQHPELGFEIRFEDRSLERSPEVERYLEQHSVGLSKE